MAQDSAIERFRALVPGLGVAAVVGIAATFLSLHYKASAMLFALLLGMALNFLAEEGRCLPGIQFASSVILRTGVALLGLRITISQVAALGWGTVALIAASVALTILVGIVIARSMKLATTFGVLTGGAVAICGASAALAIASILPRHKNAERDASFTVIGVTALSTFAMIMYPIVAGAFGLDHHGAGIFIGATIHDVAQVVGAGYSISQESGDVATIVKLLRVAMLLPVCVVIGLALHVRGTEAAHAAPVLPWFAAVFAALVLAGEYRLGSARSGRRRFQPLALVPGDRDLGDRHEDFAPVAGGHGAQARDADRGGDRLPRRARGRDAGLGERLLQIGLEVRQVLDPDGEPDQRIADADVGAHLGRHRGVRHDRRMLDQALDAAQALGQREDLAALEHAQRGAFAALHDRRHHAAARGHLAQRERMLRVAREPRVVHAFDLRMLREPLRDRERVLGVALHADRQRLQPARGEEAVERARHRAHGVLQEAQLLREVARARSPPRR